MQELGLAFARGELKLGSQPWGLAYFVGSMLAGTLANVMIGALFTSPNPDVPTHGGPALPLGKLEVTKRPPTVS